MLCIRKKQGNGSSRRCDPDPTHVKEDTMGNKAFAGMPKLRLLRINRVHLCGNFEHLFEELRWLCWHYCLLEYLPSNFHPKKLVILDMQFSEFKTLWTDGKHFKSLKILNLNNSKCLTKSPIFCAQSMLEELQLERCTSLMELHESIGLLDKLVYLNLKDCMNLRFLPGSICKLKSVERLNLTGCTKLEEFPEHLGHMESLTELLADGTIIKQLPFSIGLLKNLKRLSLKGCNRQFTTKSWFSLILSWVLQRKNAHSMRFLPSSISSLCSLTKLDLNYRNLSEGDFPADLRSLSSLRVLDLGGNNFRSLPHGFNHLSKLEDLSLDNCTSLQSISNLPPNLCTIHACNCSSLEKISDLPRRLKTLKMRLGKHQFHHILSNLNNDGMEDPHCFQGAQIIPSDRLNNLQTPLQHLRGRSLFTRDYFYPGDFSDIFSYKITGSSSISLEVPVVRGKDDYVAGFDVGVVYYRAGDEEGYSTELNDYPYVIITDKINGINFTYTPIFFGIPESSGDYVWSSDIIVEEHFGYRIKGGEQFQVSFIMPSPFKVKQCAMDLILLHNKGAYTAPTVPALDYVCTGALPLLLQMTKDDHENCHQNINCNWAISDFPLNKYE
ncbi:TMV resistance protein N [Camellia lanceoleosa]|uniref:TMV resistance protein N n=1 Tax=Camellia lanceoleosa TaxID=1840588 RepID=A0ACC0GM03_9ERIC|nr:TMV resistance protein N [Camellia lanceoleosa]